MWQFNSIFPQSHRDVSSQVFNKALTELQTDYPQLIVDVRDQGAIIAIERVGNGDIQQANKVLTQALITDSNKHGLVPLACGFYGNVICFLPALAKFNEIMHEGLDRFKRLFNWWPDNHYKTGV